MNVVGYVRVSTEEQAFEGVSLEAQRAKLEGYAGLHGLDLVAIEEDAGVSAKSLQRPGLARALARLDSGQVDGILVSKLDRLTRSVPDFLALVAQYFGPSDGKHLMSVSDHIETHTANGRMVLTVLMTIAQWERETIVERTREGMAHLRVKGERLGTIPWGMKLGEDGRKLEIDLAELETIAMARQLAAEGRSLRAIAAELKARGRPTKQGGPWTFSIVRKILARAS